MAEASGGYPMEMRQELVRRSVEDEELRQRLLDDPKATVEQELNTAMPQEIEIRAVEEKPDTAYLVLPPKLEDTPESRELSDRELESVAGGWDYTSVECSCWQCTPDC
ncbi:MAG: NHLP leader peptide family RiPP precursor [Rubrobacteraceae bacterium]